MNMNINEEWMDILEWASTGPEPKFSAKEKEYLLALVDNYPESEHLIAKLIKECFLSAVGESVHRDF